MSFTGFDGLQAPMFQAIFSGSGLLLAPEQLKWEEHRDTHTEACSGFFLGREPRQRLEFQATQVNSFFWMASEVSPRAQPKLLEKVS